MQNYHTNSALSDTDKDNKTIQYLEISFLRFSSCQNRDSLLGSPGILGRAGLLQVTPMWHMCPFFMNITVC